MTNYKRRTLVAIAAIAVSAPWLSLSVAAQTAEPAGTISSKRILDTLNRDIVLDQPSAAGQLASPLGKPQPGLDLSVPFAFNSADLLPQGRKQLDELGKALNNRSLIEWGFELAGHTDAVGSRDYNLKLSLERAIAVKNYLVVKHGLNPNRLVPIGFGFSRLAFPADPKAGVNRRVEVRRVALVDGRAITLEQSAGGAAMVSPLSSAPRPATGGRLVPTP